MDTSRASSTLHSFDCVGGRVASRFARDSLHAIETRPRHCLLRVRCSYKFKFLRTATCMPTALMGSTDGDHAGVSRVQMDAQGMLKVQHLLHIARPASSSGGGFGGGGGGGVRQTAGGTMDSLADPPASLPYTGGLASDEGGGSVVVPVTFVLFPEEKVEADAQADDDAGPASRAEPAPRSSPEL